MSRSREDLAPVSTRRCVDIVEVGGRRKHGASVTQPLLALGAVVLQFAEEAQPVFLGHMLVCRDRGDHIEEYDRDAW